MFKGKKGSVAVLELSTGVCKPCVETNLPAKMTVEGYEVNESSFQGLADCSGLPHRSDASVLENLRQRYTNDVIYVCHITVFQC